METTSSFGFAGNATIALFTDEPKFGGYLYRDPIGGSIPAWIMCRDGAAPGSNGVLRRRASDVD